MSDVTGRPVALVILVADAGRRVQVHLEPLCGAPGPLRRHPQGERPQGEPELTQEAMRRRGH